MKINVEFGTRVAQDETKRGKYPAAQIFQINDELPFEICRLVWLFGAVIVSNWILCPTRSKNEIIFQNQIPMFEISANNGPWSDAHTQ